MYLMNTFHIMLPFENEPIFYMIYACVTGSIFNFKVVRGVSGYRDTAICLQLFMITSSSTQSCYCLLVVLRALHYKPERVKQLNFIFATVLLLILDNR